MRIAIPIFERLTALDAVGPYEILQRLPDVSVHFVGEKTGTIRTENGFLGLSVDATFDDLREPDVVVVPGGAGANDHLQPGPLHEWLHHAHATSQFTTSVCSGSLILASAGLLTGLTATSHWSSLDTLASLGAQPTDQRVVEHLSERIITAAGVSAGIDMALRLAELLFDADTAMAMQLLTEYDPQPPFGAGSSKTASPEVMQIALDVLTVKN